MDNLPKWEDREQEDAENLEHLSNLQLIMLALAFFLSEKITLALISKREPNPVTIRLHDLLVKRSKEKR